MTAVSHDPGECKAALARTSDPVVLDLETTGLHRWNRIVSAGVLVDRVPYILFAGSTHASITNLSQHAFRDALQPLQRSDLVIIGHNLPFDLGFLRRAGIAVNGEARDTLKLLRLIDQDRGGGQDRHRPRIDLRAPGGPEAMNYKLKPTVGRLLSIRMKDFPGNMELAPYEVHTRYLASDLVGTGKLYEYLWPRLTETERTYYQTMVAPMVPLMLDMSEAGVAADCDFLIAEAARLERLMGQISEVHEQQHGVALGMNEEQARQWLFQRLKLPVLKKKRQGKQWVPSLDAEAFRRLHVYNEDPTTAASLCLIQEYRQAASLLVRLRSLQNHIDRNDGRIHSSFDDRQATGRISSSYPNLQQLAKPREFGEETIRSRNVLRASPGFELAVFDIGQADIRALAHAVESFRHTGDAYQQLLKNERRARLEAEIGSFLCQRNALRNPNFSGQPQEQPLFSPDLPPDLAADFADPTGDFYTLVVQRILGRAPKDKAERNRFKGIILSTVNGQGPPSLAKALDCTEPEARTFLRDFETAYPKVARYKQLMHWQIAYTGQTATFLGRTRTMTAHRWLVTEPRVEILVSYRRGEVYWVEIVPLEAGLRVLTSYVLRAWNAKTNKLIYDHQRGRLSNQPYHLFDTTNLLYFLPIRNWGWRSIRRVRCNGEEAAYEGFDATARAAFNFICQGGTADICKLMMLRCQPVCQQFGARLLIQIHDELVFEVPKERADAFIAAMKPVLEQPPTPAFKVPIVVEAKRGERFGELTTLKF